MSTKDRVGYWKNGKWSTLHVDFIDDVDHWAFGIGKWDYYIYLLDYPNVLKNSGIFRLKDCELFSPSHHGISVSEGKCYVVGFELSDTSVNPIFYPVLYTERKGAFEKERLPFPDGTGTGEAIAIYSYDRNHFIAGGYAGREPTIWIDRQPHVLPRSFVCPDDGLTHPHALVQTITRCNGHIYCGGFESTGEDDKIVATLWCDDVPQHLTVGADKDNYYSGRVVEVVAYGDDVYALTSEIYDNVHNAPMTVSALWLNGKLLKTYNNMMAISFAVF